MIIIGLTGSIGMGKSTTAKLFSEEGVAVWDADAAVHRLYAAGGAGVAPLLEVFPQAAHDDGGVDRARLSAIILKDPAALQRLEAIIHPLVRQDQAEFLAEANRNGAEIVVLDIPLLVESGQAGLFETIVVVSADEAVRRERVLEREGMTEAKLDAILGRQASEKERLAVATHTVRTDNGIAAARAEVRAILAALREKHGLPTRGEPGLGEV